MQEVARRLGRVASTISRRLRRNACPTAASRIVRRQRNAPSALLAAQSRPACAQRGVKNLCRGTVVWRRCGSERGSCSRPGRVLEKPSARTWKDRRWASAWSPEQIARRLPVDFADDATMRISHEAIYQALFVQGRGALRRELTACLRTGRVLRMPRARTRGQARPSSLPRS